MSLEATLADSRCFPSTRYQGSKRKIVPWLWECFRELDFTSVLDAFGGTGSVSYLLKKMGKKVTYNDLLHFNHQIGLALIENDEVTLQDEDVAFVLTPSRTETPSFVRDTFKGVYFTNKENAWIDTVIARINQTKAPTNQLRYKQALLNYALFQSCLIKRPFNLFHRRNLYLRLADVEREFGNKVSWDRPFSEHFAVFCLEASKSVFEGKNPCQALQGDVLDLPKAHYDLVYIDPPYLSTRGTNESADYRRCYHFLEGICQYGSWGKLIDYDTPNLRLRATSNDRWICSDENTGAFDLLFDKFAKSILVLSYKKHGVPSIDTLIRMLRRHGRKVRSHSRHYKYALNHQNGSAKLNRECLIIAE